MNRIKVTQLLIPEEAVNATVATAKALLGSRDASKEGPLKGYMEYRNPDFRNGSE